MGSTVAACGFIPSVKTTCESRWLFCISNSARVGNSGKVFAAAKLESEKENY